MGVLLLLSLSLLLQGSGVTTVKAQQACVANCQYVYRTFYYYGYCYCAANYYVSCATCTSILNNQCIPNCFGCGGLSLPNGVVTYTNSDRGYSVATHYCYAGYALAPGQTPTRQCVPAYPAFWTDSIARTCIGNVCQALSNPVNGGNTALLAGNPARYPTAAAFTCIAGYQIAPGNTSVVYCGTNGLWYKNPGNIGLFNDAIELPICIDVDECALGISNCSQLCTNTVGGFTCGCKKGYVLSGFNTCLGLPCASLGTLANGIWQFNNLTSTTNTFNCPYPCQARMVCDQGYTPLNSTPNVCSDDLTWSLDFNQTLCIGQQCLVPASPVSSVTLEIYQGSLWPNYPPFGRYGDTISVGCNTGYRPDNGSFSWTCAASGVWSCSGANCTMPGCDAVPCNTPPTYDNGVALTTNGGFFPSNITYPCFPGYKVTGADGIYPCRAPAMDWANTSALCHGHYCGAPPNGSTVSYTYTSTEFPSIATYTCLPGFYTASNLTIACLPNGTTDVYWPEAPICYPRNFTAAWPPILANTFNDTLSLYGHFGETPNITMESVTYGTATNPNMYPCPNITVVSGARVTCQPSGVGGPLAVSLTVRSQVPSTAGRFNLVLQSAFYFPPPILSDTIRVTYIEGSVEISPPDGIRLKSNVGGDVLTIAGKNFGTDLNRVFVTFSDSTGNSAFICFVTTVADTQLTCTVPSGDGSALRIKVGTGIKEVDTPPFGPTIQWSNASIFQIFYPAGPSIDTVRGCPIDKDDGTSSCATTGGTIQVRGRGFSGDLNLTSTPPVVTVAGENCDYINHSHSQIDCLLPQGTGLNQLVLVATNQGMTQKTLVSYIVPTVLNITGCLTNCSRAGGDIIWISGENFGACCASVVVGGLACTSVTHQPESPHALLKCVLPPAKGLSKTVFVQQVRGQVAPARGHTISYEQCSLGTYDEAAPSLACKPCAVGKYTDSPSASVCFECEHGKYQDRQGQSSCILAERGRYVNSTGSSNSALCAEGMFASTEGLSQCTPCDPGTYAVGMGNAICLSCPRGTSQSLSNQSSCVSCSPGTVSSSTGQYSCLECPMGRFQPNASQTICNECSQGKFSISTTACMACEAGKITNRDGMASCESCSPGFYQSAVQQSVCLSCPPGSSQPNFGASGCELCAVGKFQRLYEKQLCDDCLAGFASNVTGALGCQVCPAGFHSAQDGQTSCQICEPGTYAVLPGQVVCYLCAKGFAGPTAGLTACSACPSGQYSPIEGSARCFNCSQGTVSQASASSACSPCDIGFAAPSPAMSLCVACAAGTYAPVTGTPSCLPCALGFYSENSQTSACKQCDIGRSSNVLGLPENCPLCIAGTFNGLPASTGCAACSRGEYALADGSSTCLNCAPGTYADEEGMTRCLACASGRFAASFGTETCLSCSEGYYSAFDGSTVCTACAPGSYANETESIDCEVCELGRYVDFSGQSTCNGCEVGKYGNNPTYCTPCDPGTYTNTTGNEECTACPPGTFTAGNGLSLCFDCSPGRYALVEHSRTCDFCDPGSFAERNGSSSCQFCVPGTAAPDSGLSACRNCTPGSFARSNGTIDCSLCALGSAQNSSSQSQCLRCPPGNFADKQGMLECVACSPGRSTTGLNIQDHCEACESGKYANISGSPMCVDCPLGRYVETPGQGECFNCAPGTYSDNPGSAGCSLCPRGRFANDSGTTTCADCAVGTEASAVASPECDSCQVGKYAGSGSSRCAVCEQGRFNTVNRSAFCNECPVGKFAAQEGSTECALCTIGRMANSLGQVVCAFCVPGRFSNTTGASICSDCPSGRSQDSSFSTSCTECDIGKASLGGQAQCEECPAQTAQPYKAQPACLRCDPNAKQAELKDECLCNDGFYAPPRKGFSEPLLSCEPCPKGGDCSLRGTTFANIGSAYGYWRQDSSQAIFYQCQMPDFCPGGNVSTCGGHRTGALCGFCMPGFTASGSGGLGECTECANSAPAAQAVGFILLAGIVIACQYYFVLFSDRDLLRELKKTQTRKEAKQMTVDSSKFETFEESVMKFTDRAIRERQRSNPIYRLKIAVGFFQIVCNLAFGISSGWPTLFRKYLLVFNLINMDFMPWGSMSCVSPLSYYNRLDIIAVWTPMGIMGGIMLFYVIPKLLLGLRRFSGEDRLLLRERVKIKFYKLGIFTIFALFPFVSSSILRLWVCRSIDGVYYLVSDMGLRCYDDAWYAVLPRGIFYLLLYPIGIPLFLYWRLVRNRNNMTNPSVYVIWGFIYAAYTEDNWWFELFIIASKLYLSSLVVFFDEGLRYGAVLIWLGLFIIVCLLRKPYINNGDDRLQLFAILEIYMMVSFAWVTRILNIPLSDVNDILLSIFLIFLTLVIPLAGFYMVSVTFYESFRLYRLKKRRATTIVSPPSCELTLEEQTEEEQANTYQTKLRVRDFTLDQGHRRAKSALHGEGEDLVSHAHVAPARFGGQMLAALPLSQRNLHEPTTKSEGNQKAPAKPPRKATGAQKQGDAIISDNFHQATTESQGHFAKPPRPPRKATAITESREGTSSD